MKWEKSFSPSFHGRSGPVIPTANIIFHRCCRLTRVVLIGLRAEGLAARQLRLPMDVVGL